MSDFVVKTVIAETKIEYLHEGGEKTEVTVTVGAPVQVGEQEWICRFEVRGISGEGFNRVYQANGADSVQALVLSLQLAGSVLSSAASIQATRFPDWQVARNFGFPPMPKTSAEERARFWAELAEQEGADARKVAEKAKKPRKRKKT